MSAARRLAMVREIEKGGGEITCWIDDGEHVVTVRLADGRSIEVRNAAAYDLEEAFARFTVARITPPLVSAPEPPRPRPGKSVKARTRTVDSSAIKQPEITERLPLRERLKQRNTAA